MSSDKPRPTPLDEALKLAEEMLEGHYPHHREYKVALALKDLAAPFKECYGCASPTSCESRQRCSAWSSTQAVTRDSGNITHPPAAIQARCPQGLFGCSGIDTPSSATRPIDTYDSITALANVLKAVQELAPPALATAIIVRAGGWARADDTAQKP